MIIEITLLGHAGEIEIQIEFLIGHNANFMTLKEYQLTILCLRTTNLCLFKTYTEWEYISVMHSYFTSPKSLKQCNQGYF